MYDDVGGGRVQGCDVTRLVGVAVTLYHFAMSGRLTRAAALLWFSVGSAALFAACGDNAAVAGDGNKGFGGNAGSAGSAAGGTGGSAATDSGAGNGGTLNIDGGGSGGSGQGQGFEVQPQPQQVITVPLGSSSPSVSYTATFNGQPVAAGWVVDRGDIGSVTLGTAATGVFTPTGRVGGLVTVTAGLNGETQRREVLVKLEGEQNGVDASNPDQATQIPADIGDLTEGGGVAGVGGEGLGGAVTDGGVLAALDTPASGGGAEGLKLLYPYDRTVFPRGILAPLLAWDWSLGDAEAIRIELSTQSGSFSWRGTFGRPAILAQTGGKFIRHPIPQDVWAMATNSAGGNTDKLSVKLTIAQGGQAYGPISQTWTIAPARLSGIIYYNSYGTNLAKNFSGAVGGDGRFGGAVLSIKVGDPGPSLTAGGNGDSSACRVCHSVAADGSRLVTQIGNNTSASAAYDLSPTGSTETPMGIGAEFPGIYPDGSMALAPNGQLLPLPGAAAALPATGLSAVATNVGTPIFSPNGKHVAINPMASGSIASPTQKLVVLDFDPATLAFTNPVEVADHSAEAASVRPGWAAFLPDNSSLVYQRQSVAGSDGNSSGAMWTRKGSKAQIYWTDTAGPSSVTPLNQLNGLDAAGVSYLPKLPSAVSLTCSADGVSVGGMDADHGDDANLNYEPTVNPIPGGGYAWVVFTSRRMYGNVATIPPFCSDPRGVDLIQHITTKKLWVAAVDLSAAPGTDASHPAFYLPGQELLAGNSRGFWVQDPCRSDGSSCESGDQCCNGYCQPNASTGALECSNEPPGGQCSQVQEKCEVAADCCDSTNECLNGFCAQGGPR